MHLFARVRVRHALHEGHQIVLRAPLAAAPQHLSGMNIERGNQRLGAMTDIFKLTTTQPSRSTIWGASGKSTLPVKT